MKVITTNQLMSICLSRKKALTPTRALIIITLSKYKRPKSAYDLQDELNKIVKNKINISTIYRVLAFWIELGLVHKISSINKFFLCLKPEEEHTHIINFCTKCEKVVETCDEVMTLNFKKSIAKLNLYLDKKSTIEIPVLCASCS